MRLKILDQGHQPIQKIQLRIIRWLIGQVPGPIQMAMYRSDFFGIHLVRCVQEALQGDSEWSPHERELFASFVSKLNSCRY